MNSTLLINIAVRNAELLYMFKGLFVKHFFSFIQMVYRPAAESNSKFKRVVAATFALPKQTKFQFENHEGGRIENLK